jgi:hypothetical protein
MFKLWHGNDDGVRMKYFENNLSIVDLIKKLLNDIFLIVIIIFIHTINTESIMKRIHK